MQSCGSTVCCMLLLLYRMACLEYTGKYKETKSTQISDLSVRVTVSTNKAQYGNFESLNLKIGSTSLLKILYSFELFGPKRAILLMFWTNNKEHCGNDYKTHHGAVKEICFILTFYIKGSALHLYQSLVGYHSIIIQPHKS